MKSPKLILTLVIGSGDLISIRLFAVFCRISSSAKRVRLALSLWSWNPVIRKFYINWLRMMLILICSSTYFLCGVARGFCTELYLLTCWQEISHWLRSYPKDVFGGRFVRGIQNFISNRWDNQFVGDVLCCLSYSYLEVVTNVELHQIVLLEWVTIWSNMLLLLFIGIIIFLSSK